MGLQTCAAPSANSLHTVRRKPKFVHFWGQIQRETCALCRQVFACLQTARSCLHFSIWTGRSRTIINKKWNWYAAGVHKNMVRGMFTPHLWKIISLRSCSAPNMRHMRTVPHVNAQRVRGTLVYVLSESTLFFVITLGILRSSFISQELLQILHIFNFSSKFLTLVFFKSIIFFIKINFSKNTVFVLR